MIERKVVLFVGSKRQKAILKYIQQNDATNAKELAQVFDVTERTIREDVKHLKELVPIEVKPGRFGGGIFWVGKEPIDYI